MSTQYLSNVAVMIAAGFVVIATQAFPATTVAWLTLAVAVGLSGVSLYMLVGHKGVVQRLVGGLGSVLGAWTIVASAWCSHRPRRCRWASRPRPRSWRLV